MMMQTIQIKYVILVSMCSIESTKITSVEIVVVVVMAMMVKTTATPSLYHGQQLMLLLLSLSSPQQSP